MALAVILALAVPALGAPGPSAHRSLALEASPRGDDSRSVRVVVTASGRTRAASAGSKIEIQQSVGGGWRTLARDRMNASGRLALRVAPVGSRGVAKLRARSRAPSQTSRIVKVALEAPARDVLVGFNNNAVTDRVASPDQAADLLSAVGADIDRVQVSWAALEPVPGEYRFALLDAIYEADLARGVRPLFIFAFAPAWASESPCAAALSSCHAPPAREHYGDAARAAALIAERYPGAAGIEIWNEPNTPYFWRPMPDPRAYADLLARCHDAIKAVAPGMRVAGGSMASGVAGSPGKIPATQFLEALYAHGAADEMDAISMHAYPDPGAETAVSAVSDVLEVRDGAGERSTPVWVTETGVTTTGPSGASEAEQADLMRELDRGLRAVPGVRMVLQHTLMEPPRGSADAETGYGVVTASGRRKPAFCELARAWGRPGAC